MYGQPPSFRRGGGGDGLAPPFQHLRQPQLFNANPLGQFDVPITNTIPNFQTQNAINFIPHHQPQFPNRRQPPESNEALEKLDRAVVKACRELMEAGESVSAWKVSEAALLALKAVSWESLGFQMQQIPSLFRLMLIEGKIISFIHCFVGARRITSLYDLEVAICKNEGVEQFEELELGPLLRHPLVLHYFSVSSDVKEVCKISSEDIVSYLWKFLDEKKNNHIKVEDFLDFLAKKQSVSGREKLSVRIQSLGMHIGFIREARRQSRQSQDSALEKCTESLKKTSKAKRKRRPLFSLEKKQLDDRFVAFSQRISSFSSEHRNICGKHIRFTSSSSEDEDSDNCESEDRKSVNATHCLTEFSLQNNCVSDKVTSCPYPSVSEEMTRLGLKSEMNSSTSPFTGTAKFSEGSGPSKRKRKSESSVSSPTHKLPRRCEDGAYLLVEDGFNNAEKAGLSLPDETIRMFITTWKEACQETDVAGVLERMLQFYKPKKRKQMRRMFSSYPCIGLLNLAVSYIKCGIWDSVYDTLQTLIQGRENTLSTKGTDYVSIEVEPMAKDYSVATEHILKHDHGVAVENILKKVSEYFDIYDGIHVNPPMETKLSLLRKLCKCERWLIEQFSAKDFESFGYGDFFTFLEKYVRQLPAALQMCLSVDNPAKLALEACMVQNQLDVLLSQALNCSWDSGSLSKQKISELLMRQFPSVCFKLIESGSPENFQDIVAVNKSNAVSHVVVFSAALSKMTHNGEFGAYRVKDLIETANVRTDTSSGAGVLGSVTSKDAIELLLKAPMLIDLDLWSHWDLIFAPSLGPLVGWLLNEVNTRELLCLVTKGGKVLRVDQSATVDSFLDAFLQESPFQTAVRLLSLYSLFGGEKNVPTSLLKFHAQKGFEVIVKNSMELEIKDGQKVLIGISISKLPVNEIAVNKPVAVASRFILDCLGYLPVELWSWAADILLSGFRDVFKDASSAILSECKRGEQRLMLHEVGLTLGIMEWINDYHSFSSTSTELPMASGASSLKVETTKVTTPRKYVEDSPGKFEHETMVPINMEWYDKDYIGLCSVIDNAGVSGDNFGQSYVQHSSVTGKVDDPTIIIETIRQEEFGLGPSLSSMESNMLKKQHARLGRALHCLSQELYSQDSHFLLELVQNADDNIYPENVEPTLTFILEQKGIIVLNNEQGFSVDNIKALCDVGNSTKKGSMAGYIGKKGIGFKSVFRVTDAPEIHSNGFHIKFDVSEGEIGFVLPTVVPPCNVDLFRRLVSLDTDQTDSTCWNTCIVLPFRSKLSTGIAIDNIISMFSDLHPSLLLFLHRLHCIKFRNMINDSLVVMKKVVVGDGIIEVSLGKEKMTWFVVSHKLQADVFRPDVQTTEISLAFTLQESSTGSYIPLLDQQPVFAFLPLRTYGLKFILQGDFVLPSSREEVDGDSPWNQWLLSEFPGLFVSAERRFCGLPCFRDNPGKAVAAFMSFVPLVGEVQGFFSSLPRMIISKLRMSNCLLLEGDTNEWVPPCKVIRNWTEKARVLLPNSLLREHLGLGFLNKDIILSDSLARSLGVEEYGPKILFQVISSLCHTQNGLKSQGLAWLSSWLNAIYEMSFHSYGEDSINSSSESDLIVNLRKIQFIPLSDGKYGSVEEGTIWLHSSVLSTEIGKEYGSETFPILYARLRTVDPALFSAASDVDKSCFNTSVVQNITRMLCKVGVQQLSAHEIVKIHILPAICDEINTLADKELMTEYLSFAMFHLQSSCPHCYIEREHIFSELRNKALILTNDGYKRAADVSIHFNKEFGNPIDIKKLINGIDIKWHEVDLSYLQHSITKLVSGGVLKWRSFFQELGVTDFVRIVQIDKNAASLSNVVLKNMLWERDTIPLGAIARDWESQELVHLLAHLSSSRDRKRCKYLLEIIDTLWDEYFSDKTIGHCDINVTGESKPFKSSLVSIFCDVQWTVSSMDDELHYPQDLFHDCDAVRSILGGNAPYAVPKVRSEKMLNDIGLKTQVILDDILLALQVWRRSSTFKASISQMSTFYAFIWNQMACAKQKILEELRAGAFIFVPYMRGSACEDIVTGEFLSPNEVYWHDLTGSVEQMMGAHHTFKRTLCNIYPGLHDFFVNECGVGQTPPPQSYLQILVELSSVALPSQAAKTVFQVFLRWTDGLKSGSLSSDDIEYLKESLLKVDLMVLPTAQDKWVSLHPSFGLVCWCDDEKLKKEFKHFDNIDFLYFGELADEEKEALHANVSVLLQRLGIPALSNVVSREAIYYGLADSSFKASLVNWALPYAQRYIYSLHPAEYCANKQSGFVKLSHLQIVVVEKLFYRNVIKRSNIESKKRFECNCLLQDNVLYATRESDSHSIFMELSRLLVDESHALHLANFLHMITTMAESGSTEEQTEFFIINSQKVPKLPDEESSWSLPLTPSSTEDETILASHTSTKVDEPHPSTCRRKPAINSSWPPANWKTAPGFDFARANKLRTQAVSSLQVRDDEDGEEIVAKSENFSWTDGGDSEANKAVVLQDSGTPKNLSDCASNTVASGMNVLLDSANLIISMDAQTSGSFNFSESDQLSLGPADAQQAWLTGRQGEFVAFKYFIGKVGEASVNWVNETNETGLPYDIVIGESENSREYIEVKATKSARKDWSVISAREWQFAVEMGETYSIAHVVLLGNNMARVTVYKNPVRLCQLGKLQLAVMMPKQPKEFLTVF